MNDALDILYLLLLALFGSLTLHALFTTMMRATALNQDLQQLKEQLHDREERLEEIRLSLRQMDIENGILTEERKALESQEACMRQLEKSYHHTSSDPDNGA
jgi:hypothetical protein